MKTLPKAFLFLSFLLCVPSLALSDFSGPVVGVIDGDTIDVLHNGQAERIRLNGIDCPEKGQAFGKTAKHFTSSLAYGKKVTIQVLREVAQGWPRRNSKGNLNEPPSPVISAQR